MARNSLSAIGIAVIILLAAVGCGSDSTSSQNSTGLPRTLKVGVIPNVSPEKQRAQYEPFRQYLQKQLGGKVELFVATDYTGVVTALVAHKVDIAYLGGLTYVQAAEQDDITPLVTEVDSETGTREYLSAVVVKSTSSFTSTKDVVAARGRFAFGDPSSTSGSLYPRVMLTRAGARCDARDISRCPPLEKVTFTGGHDATAQAVHNGSVDAGGVELRILHRLERQGAVPKGALRVVDTHKVMGYPWVAREGLGGPARDAVVRAFTSITDPALLDLLRAKRYVPVSAADYAEVRTFAANLGLLTPSR
ncbi:MAG TPA: phosphate/phosphite/phosphonate ABC transporter substrate-binding protein [Streptosporangiaceae bacterium]|jgi:phosphonate transport system substrate-binding protein|nr:phosphate/phosphite/phosphonate ABC transporter substrate-binding protein [Streptosporangiaceae bacterium]